MQDSTQEEAKLDETLTLLKSEFGTRAPDLVLVLGSGLSDFVDQLQDSKKVSFAKFAHFGASDVEGHRGELAVGKIKGRSVAVMAGRIHGYEGWHPYTAVHLHRALRKWGAQVFILTNAAGSTRKSVVPASLSLIKDQINFTGRNPLIGKEVFGGPRFPDLSDLYNRGLRKQILKISRAVKVPLKEGVYVGCMGPAYESAAEIKMFAQWGGDLIGMSTVWEALAVHQMGARVVGISCVTNFCTGVSKQPLSHQEVMDNSAKAKGRFTRLLLGILEKVKF